MRILEKALEKDFDPNRHPLGWASQDTEVDREDFIDLAKVKKQVPGKTPSQVYKDHYLCCLLSVYRAHQCFSEALEFYVYSATYNRLDTVKEYYPKTSGTKVLTTCDAYVSYLKVSPTLGSHTRKTLQCRHREDVNHF